MAASERVAALVIHGMRDPSSATSAAGVVFTSKDIPAAALPSPLSGYTVVPWLEQISGDSWTSDPRQVIGPGGEAEVILKDPDAVLGTLLLRNALTDSWDIQATRIEDDAATITVSGAPGALPTANQIVWIGREAVKIGGVSALALGNGSSTVSANLTGITRGACGSFAQLHRLDPLAYFAESDGSEARLQLDARPNFAANAFFCSLYLLALDQNGAPAGYLRRFGYLKATPTPLRGRFWKLQVSDLGELIAEHQLGDEARAVTLSHGVHILELGHSSRPIAPSPEDVVADVLGQGSIPEQSGVVFPTSAAIFLDRLEAERFFREPLHKAGLKTLDSTMCTDLFALFNAIRTSVDLLVEIEAGAKWLYKVSGFFFASVTRPGESTARTFVRLTLTIVDREKGKSFSLEEGFAKKAATPVPAGQSAPKVSLRYVLRSTPVEAFLRLMISDGAATGTTYDVLPGRVGLGLPPSFFNISTGAVSVLGVTIQTKKLAERNQLLTQKYHYHLQLAKEQALGDFLRGDLFLLHSLLPGPLSTGEWTLRPWVYPAPASPPEVVTPAGFVPEPGQRLELLRAIQLSSGFRLLTLAPEYVRTLRLVGARARGEEDSALPIRVWQPGNHIGLEALTTGALSTLIRAWVYVYGGEPIAHEIETSLDWLEDEGIEYCDFVSWSNDEILSYDGQGVSGSFLVFGISLDWGTKLVKLRIIEDTFNTLAGAITESVSAPTLRPVKVRPVAGSSTQVDILVESLGDSSFDASVDHDAIWDAVRDAESLIRITLPDLQNPTGTTERDGALESYAKIATIIPDARGSWLRLTFDSSWTRNGEYALTDLIKRTARLELPDRRASEANPQGVLIEPPAAALYNDGAGADLAKVSGALPYDRTLTLFSS
jgi:hypothetical protein